MYASMSGLVAEDARERIKKKYLTNSNCRKY